MNKKISMSLLAGVTGTAAMTLITLIAPMMGMPKMSPPAMLSGMLGVPLFAGWIMHFMIGILFAFAYAYSGFSRLKADNVYLKGAAFGTIVFVFAQIIMGIMGAMMTMPAMEGSKVLKIVGSFIGHIVYGMTVSKTVSMGIMAKPRNTDLP